MEGEPLDEHLRRDLETIDVVLPAFRVDAALWHRVIEAGLEDDVRQVYANEIASAAKHAILTVCMFLEPHGIVISGSWLEDDEVPPRLQAK